MNEWPCRLVRGAVEFGTIAHDSREDGGCCQVAWLQPTPAFESVSHLFAEEFKLVNSLCVAGMDATMEADIWSRIAAVQQDIVAPGVQMIRLDDGQVYEAEELHVEGLKVFWR